MNKNRKFQAIPAALVERCRDYGETVNAHRSQNSLAVSGPWGADRDPVRQMWGKLGEVACALYFGLDPNSAVSWIYRPDSGNDIKLPSNLLADVKTTMPWGNLVWPKTLNHIFWEKRFDLLISVSLDQWGDLGRFWIEGYVSKREFFERKLIADGVSKPKLDKDTWYMPKRDLYDIGGLVKPARPEPGDLTPLVRVCHQCKKPHDGTEQEVWIAGFMLWLHRSCQPLYLRRIEAVDSQSRANQVGDQDGD